MAESPSSSVREWCLLVSPSPPLPGGSRPLAGVWCWGSLSRAVVPPLRLLFPLLCRPTLQPALPPPSPPLPRRPVTPSRPALDPARPPCSGSPPPRHLPPTPSVSVRGQRGGVALCCGWCHGAGARGGRTLSLISRAGRPILLQVIKHIDHSQRVHLCAITAYPTADAFLAGSDPLEVVRRCAELFTTGGQVFCLEIVVFL